MEKMIMWLAVGDEGKHYYWPSLSVNKMDCKAKIYDDLYKPFGDKPDWSKIEFIKVRISPVGWETITYGSGTHIVTRNDFEKPHYYVYADKRYEVCKELEAWLNGGPDPRWRFKLVRWTDESVKGPEGIHIYTTGPFILPPDDNGALNWQVDPDKKQERMALIDKLLE